MPKSKFQTILDELGIDEKDTKPVKRNKIDEFNHIKDNIPHIANYNMMMANLLELPNDNGYRYLFVIVDLATNAFD